MDYDKFIALIFIYLHMYFEVQDKKNRDIKRRDG